MFQILRQVTVSLEFIRVHEEPEIEILITGATCPYQYKTRALQQKIVLPAKYFQEHCLPSIISTFYKGIKELSENH